MKVGRIDGDTVHLTTKIRQATQDTIESLVGQPLKFVLEREPLEPAETRLAKHQLQIWKQKQQQ